ncbi:hypothetical protein [Devosia sp. XK-2]|uniref:hypothetical protein n=1 Tax=Devosia sp. XK-2 TaxID=3126689 RepID=UPI0030D516C1
MLRSAPTLGMGLALGGRPAFEPEALALFARMSVQPDTRRKGLINTLIAGLKQAGVWSRLDAFYMLAAHDAQAARLNWVADAYNLTAVNNPSFEVDRGYTGNGINAYLDTGFNPATAGGKFSLNDAHLGVWCLTDASEDKNDIGNLNARIFARNSGGAISGRMNDNAAPSVAPVVTTAIGHTLLSRENSAGYRIDKDGVARTTAANPSSSISSGNFWILGANGGTQSARQLAMAHFGRHLITSVELHALTEAYLAAP